MSMSKLTFNESPHRKTINKWKPELGKTEKQKIVPDSNPHHLRHPKFSLYDTYDTQKFTNDLDISMLQSIM